MPPTDAPTATSAPPKLGALRDELHSLRIDRSRKRQTSWLALLAWLLLGGAILAAASGGAFFVLKDRLFPLPMVKTDTVRVMTLGQARTELTATGYLESRWQAAVGAKVPGRIANIPVEEGDKVKAGDVLAELEHSDLDATLASRKVAIETAQAQLAESELNLAQAERDYKREQDLFERGAGTRSTYEKAETLYRAARAIRTARQSAVEAARAAVREAEEAVRNMFIYAPFDGTVVTKDAEKGESIMPGGMGASSGRGSVITLAKLDELEVDTDVKEDYLGQLHRGQPTEVLVDAVPGRRYQGRLREIMPMGDRTRGIVKVKVSILDPDERLFPELSATVNFLPDEKEGDAETRSKKGIFIVQNALQGSGDDRFVWIIDENRVQKIEVKPAGEPNDGLIPVTSSLTGGESIIVDPPADLNEGDEVRTNEQ